MARQVQDYSQGNARVRVDALRIGQRVDLQNDPFADPKGLAIANGDSDDAMGDHPEFEFEFEVVMEIIVEDNGADPCTVIVFESDFTCGFPPDHLVDVDGEQPTVTIKVWSSRLGWRWDDAEDHGGFDRISPSKGFVGSDDAVEDARATFKDSIVVVENGTPDHYGAYDGDAE